MSASASPNRYTRTDSSASDTSTNDARSIKNQQWGISATSVIANYAAVRGNEQQQAVNQYHADTGFLYDSDSDSSLALLLGLQASERNKEGEESEEEIEQPEAEEQVSMESACELYHKEKGEDPKVLFAFCVGLSKEDEDRPLLDLEFNEEPHKTAREGNKSAFKVSNTYLKNELVRRQLLVDAHEPKKRASCANWTRDKLLQALVDFAIDNSSDIRYIREEELKLRTTLQGKIDAEREEKESAKRWNEAMIKRWIHCLIEDDDLIRAYIERHNAETRLEMDGRHSPDRPIGLHEKWANKHNTASYKPRSKILPNLHQDFAVEEDLSLEKVGGKITPEMSKNKLADIRAATTIVVARWEGSGNGDGNRSEGDEDYGHHICQGEMISHKDDIRSSFIQDYHPSVLYFWQMMLDAHLLKQSLTRLDKAQGADVDNTPTVSEGSGSSKKSRKRTLEEEERRELTQQISVGITALSLSSLLDQIGNLEDKVLNLNLQLIELQVDEFANAQKIELVQKTISDVEKRMSAIKSHTNNISKKMKNN